MTRSDNGRKAEEIKREFQRRAETYGDVAARAGFRSNAWASSTTCGRSAPVMYGLGEMLAERAEGAANEP